jgi:hypothetical protein
MDCFSSVDWEDHHCQIPLAAGNGRRSRCNFVPFVYWCLYYECASRNSRFSVNTDQVIPEFNKDPDERVAISLRVTRPRVKIEIAREWLAFATLIVAGFPCLATLAGYVDVNLFILFGHVFIARSSRQTQVFRWVRPD